MMSKVARGKGKTRGKKSDRWTRQDKTRVTDGPESVVDYYVWIYHYVVG